MIIIHISDLHIGLKLFNRDLLSDQEYILDRIVEITEENKPDAVLIAGDIYDKAVPSAEAMTLFSRFMDKLTAAVPEAAIMAISGNHDSGPRINSYRHILSRQNLYMIGTAPQSEEDHIEKVTLLDEYGPVYFYLLPFVKPSMIKNIVGQDENGNNLSYNDALHKLIGREEIDPSGRNVLVSHQFYLPKDKIAEDVERMESEIRTVGNIDQVMGDVLETFDYAALGHIHKPMKVGSEFFRYCGTPMAYSVDEAGQEKGLILVELKDKGDVTTRVIPIEPRHQVRVIKGDLKSVLEQGTSDYVTVILTDKVDLDVIDMQDRIRVAFPNLLEIRRENVRRANYDRKIGTERELDPYELCCKFLATEDQDEIELLSDVINTVKGAM